MLHAKTWPKFSGRMQGQEKDEVGWAPDEAERWTVKDTLDGANPLPKRGRRSVRTQTKRRRERDDKSGK